MVKIIELGYFKFGLRIQNLANNLGIENMGNKSLVKISEFTVTDHAKYDLKCVNVLLILTQGF